MKPSDLLQELLKATEAYQDSLAREPGCAYSWLSQETWQHQEWRTDHAKATLRFRETLETVNYRLTLLLAGVNL